MKLARFAVLGMGIWLGGAGGGLIAGCSTELPRRAPGGGSGGQGEGGGGGDGGTGGAGGGGQVDATVPADAPPSVPLKIVWWGTQDRHERTIKVLDMFTRHYPDVGFSWEYAAYDEYWAKLKAYRDAGTLPDIMQQDYAYIAEWASKGLLLPLDDMAAPGGPLDLADVPKLVVDGGRVAGKLVGVSLGSNTQCFILDVDLFRNAGVPLPAADWTWADFDRIARAFKTSLNMWGYGTALYHFTSWKALYLSAGTFVWNQAGTALGYTDDLPWINHWKMMLGLMDAGAIPTYAQEKMQFPSSDETLLPIVMAKSAMQQIHSNQLVTIQKAAPNRNFKLVPIPRLVGGGSSVYIKPSQYLSVLAGTKHPREAAQFISFFTNDVDANAVLAAERGIPVASKVVAALKPGLDRPQVDASDLLDLVARDARPLPPPDPPQWDVILNSVYSPKVTVPILSRAITPEEGVALFRREATVLLGGTPPDAGVVEAPPGVEAGPPDAGAADAPSGEEASVGPPPGTELSFEAESLMFTPQDPANVQQDVMSSGGIWIELPGTRVDDAIDYTLPDIPAGSYELRLQWKGNNNRGSLRLAVDGTPTGEELDQYSPGQTYPTTSFGTVTFASTGSHTIRLTVTGKNQASTNFLLSADRFILVRQ